MNIEETINKIVDRVLNEELSKKIDDAVETISEDMGKMPEKRDEFDGRDSEVIGVDSNIKLQRNEEEVEEGNAFSAARAKAIEDGKDSFEVDGKTYPVEGEEDEIEESAKPDFLDLDKDGDKKEPMKKAAKDAKNESKKNVVALSESEMIELIQRLVMEQKEAKGLKDTERILKDSKKVNDEAMDAVNKKMKDYVKAGSKEAYTPDANHFPEGNGDLGEMEKEAYTPSEGVEEYITQIARSGGMENLEYDQIKPDEEWIDMNIVGSSKTGNSPEYANAVKTKANDEVKVRKDRNILAKLKKQSYNKAEQPVTDYSGKKKHTDKMAGIDVNESVKEEKSTKKVNEDIERMKSLLGHGYKTQ